MLIELTEEEILILTNALTMDRVRINEKMKETEDDKEKHDLYRSDMRKNQKLMQRLFGEIRGWERKSK